MKRRWIRLAVVCISVLCLVCAGCGNQKTEGASESDDGKVPSVSDESTETPKDDSDAAISDSGEEDDSGTADSDSEEKEEEIAVKNEGKKRITYTGNRSSVIYVTSASALPDYEELKQYDEDYFKDHALLLVTETVNSGSIDVGIQSVFVKGSVGTVTLSHEAPDLNDAAVTTDMATWLMWTEVEQGLDCQWKVANPALKSDMAYY